MAEDEEGAEVVEWLWDLEVNAIVLPVDMK
jgi:hypothetical protein